MAGRSSVDDPVKVFRFRVEIDGITRAGFTDVTGLGSTAEVVEYREGGDNSTVRKSPGLVSHDDIVLKRGQLVGSKAGGDDDFLAWWGQIYTSNVLGNALEIRREVDIVQYRRDNVEVRRWRLFECWPSGYKPISDLSGTGNEDSMEEVTLAHEGWALV